MSTLVELLLVICMTLAMPTILYFLIAHFYKDWLWFFRE